MKNHHGQNLTIDEIIKKSFCRLTTILLELWLLVLRVIGHIPLHSVRRFFYLLSGIKIPLDSTIHIGANFFNPRNISIGHDTIVGDHCFLDGRDTLSIGNHVDVASQVLIYNNEHNIHSPDFGNSYGKVEIDDYVFVGPRAIILPGVKINRGAVIAAGAVVTKTVPEFEVWGGIPAKKISDRQLKTPAYRLGRPMLFQ